MKIKINYCTQERIEDIVNKEIFSKKNKTKIPQTNKKPKVIRTNNIGPI